MTGISTLRQKPSTGAVKMAKTPTTSSQQQGGSNTPSQQPGQSSGPSQQQGGSTQKPIIRDWAAF
jgi:hypothetical protein